MAGSSVVAASIRTASGGVGLVIGYAVSSSFLASLEAEVAPDTWASLTETDSFGTIAGLFVTLLTLGLGILFAYVADLVRVKAAKHMVSAREEVERRLQTEKKEAHTP
jgi:hypothetical protein